VLTQAEKKVKANMQQFWREKQEITLWHYQVYTLYERNISPVLLECKILCL